MEPGSLVVLSCSGPREKFWGVLLIVNITGVTLRGVALDAFEDYAHQFAKPGARLLGPVTIFVPAHRIERIELDESSGPIEGLGDRFRRVTGLDPATVLARRNTDSET
jgi:hypothetical protein